MWKKDYEALAENRHYFGEFDPFGDFDDPLEQQR